VAVRDRGVPALIAFALLALAHTWPLARHPSTLSRVDSADAVTNYWILAWDAHALVSQPLRLFDANAFYPEPRTLAYSEHLIVQGVMGAPLAWLGASPVLAYNVLVWVGLTLTGWAWYWLLVRWTNDRAAGLLAGSLAAFNAHTLTSLVHMQALHVEFLPFAIAALDRVLAGRDETLHGLRGFLRVFATPRLPSSCLAARGDLRHGLQGARFRDGLKLAVWFALQALCSSYLLASSIVALAAGALVRVGEWWRQRWTVGTALVLAGALAAVLCAPFLWPYYRASQDVGLRRPYEEVMGFRGRAVNYLATGARFHYAAWSEPYYARANAAMFPGFVGLTLAAVAVGCGIAWRDRRARMLLAAGVAGVALSFGPALPGYSVLYDWLPLLRGLRAVARFGFLGLVAVAVLAGFGLAWLRVRWKAQALSRTASGVLAGLVVVAANVENARVPMAFTPFEGIPAIYDRLAAVPHAVVAEFPFPPPERMDRNVRAMLASTRHWHPILNGYSGFLPPSYVRHFEAFASFPSPSAIAALRAARVTHVVVHADELPHAVAALNGQPGVRLMAADRTIRIYALGGTRPEVE
jgi:hypothetical protein